MAKLKLNGLFLDQMSGRHGDAVVRSLRGRTFTSRPPTGPNTAPSEAQRFVHSAAADNTSFHWGNDTGVSSATFLQFPDKPILACKL